MMNKCKIELFNADGSLAHSEEKHNYVTEGFLQVIEQFARRYMFYNKGFNTQYYASPATTLHKYLLLTNNSDTLDTSEGVFDDSVLAYVDLSIPYSGSASNIGTINASESQLNNANMTMVCDFATDKANVTFQTIHVSPLTALSTPYITGLSKSVYSEFDGGTGPLCSDATYFYVLYDTTSIARINKSTLAYVDTITLDTAVGSLYDIAYDGTHFYIGDNAGIKKYDYSGVLQLSTASIAPTGITYLGGLLYLGQGDRLYSITTSFTSLTQIVDLNLSTINDLCNDGTDIYCNIANVGVSKVSTAGVILESYGAPNLAYSGLEYKDANTLYCSHYGIGEIDISKPFNVATRVRLDSPVTKNNTQTMKITYTFNFS